MRQLRMHPPGLVIVFYHPTDGDRAHAHALAERYPVAIVDNSDCNRGIAAAHNEGIRRLMAQGCSYIVLLDQDSRPGNDYPQRIAMEYERLSALSDAPIAAIGPSLIDGRTGLPYPPATGRHPFIIASGACLTPTAFEAVGSFEEQLFIDYVDAEWCWRAESLGYCCVQTPALSMTHTVGHRLLHIGPIHDIVSAPVRYYYQTRNPLLLLRRSYVPLRWKVARTLKNILRFFYVPFLPEGPQAVRYMWRGLRDGIFNHSS